MVWTIKDVGIATEYPINNPMVNRQLVGMDLFTFTIPTLSLADNTLVDIKDSDGTTVFRGYLNISDDVSDDTNRYSISQRAIELGDTYITKAGELSNSFDSTDGDVSNIVDLMITGSSWTRDPSSVDTTLLVSPGVSFFYTTKLDGLFQLLKTELGHYIWFDDISKVIGFGSSRTDRTGSPIVSIINVKKSTESLGFGYKRVGVVGATEFVFGAHTDPSYVEGDPVKYIQRTDVTDSTTAGRIAGQLWDELHTTRVRIVLTLRYTTIYEVGDLVRYDGSDYIIHDVNLSDGLTVLGVGAKKSDFNDMLNEKINLPTGEVITPSTFNHIELSNLLWSVAGHTIDTTLDLHINDLSNVADIDAQTGAVGTLGVTTATIGSLSVTTAADINANLDMHLHDLDNVADIDAQTAGVGTLGVTTATVGSLIVNTAADINTDLDMHAHKITNVGILETDAIETGTGYLNVSGDTSSGFTLSPSENCKFIFDGGSLRQYIATGDVYKWFINNIIKMTLGETSLDLNNNIDLRMLGGDIYMDGNVIDQPHIWGTTAIEFMVDLNNNTISTTTSLLFNHDGVHGNSAGLIWDKSLSVFGLKKGTAWTDLYLGGIAVYSGIDMINNNITNLADPNNPQDAATRAYVLANSVVDHGLLTGLSDDDHTQYLRTDGLRTLTGNLEIGTHDINMISGKIVLNDGTATSASIGFTTGVQNYIQRQLYSGTDYTLLSDQDYMHTWAILGTEKMHLSTADGLKMFTGINMNGLKISGLADPTLPQDAATRAYVLAQVGVSGLWEVDGNETQLITADDIDMQSQKIINANDIEMNTGQRLYIDKQTTDAASTYLKVDATSGNLQFHVPTGKAIEYHVGDAI